MLTPAASTRPAKLPGALLFLLVLGGLSCGNSADRLDRAYPVRDYTCLFYAGQKSYDAREAETFDVHLEIKNAGRAAWSSTETPPCLLSFHLLDKKREVIRRDNGRFPLPHPIKPGESCSMTVKVKAPLEAGRYVLEFDMVREGASWFKDMGSPTILLNLRVAPRVWPDDRRSLGLDEGPYTAFETSRPALNVLLKLIRITLDQDDVSFKGITGKVSGFRGGAAYPQIWLRDANTVIPASRYYFGVDHVRSWLLEHLARQKEDGSLEDWVDASGQTGKNTTESDQEASAVQAATEVCRLDGADWLLDKVAGRPVIERLENALRFVLNDRCDERTGLVKSGHNIDWGDVDIEDGDERAVDADEGTHWVAGIYAQSMFYQAAHNLAAMYHRLGDKEKSLFWSVKAQSLKKNAVLRLWQEDKGFFRVHVHLGPALRHGFDEDGLFAMGGNVRAVLSGLADEVQSKLILEKAMSRQKDYALSTASGVLLPPYPRGVFKHPLVDEPYEYQNGGQWDWFGGLLVLALYKNGFSRPATDKLLEIVSKNISNGGLFEWDDRQGAARGSDFYAGSAGSLGRALFEGYYGIDLAADSLNLEPRLGTDKARVHVRLSDSKRFVAYDYGFTPDGRTLVFAFNSNFSGRGRIRLLLPWPSRAKDSLEVTSSDYEVILDGRPVAFTSSRVNQDESVVLETDFRNHRLEVRRGLSVRTSKAKPRR